MDKGRIFAVGDIHGCLDKLQGLMKLLPLEPRRDTLVFLGDYIDRGPDSPGVIDYLLDLKTKVDNVVFLMGNHERMFLDYLDHVNRLFFLVNGGHKTINAYSKGGEFFLPADHRRFLRDLDLMYETEEYIFVHAGLRPGIPLDIQKAEDILWIRDSFCSSPFDYGKKVVFGHTIFDEPFIMQNKIGIDTGAVYGDRLTCVELPREEFYSF